MMQIYSIGTDIKYRSANLLLNLSAAFRKSQIWVFRQIRLPFTCFYHPLNAVWIAYKFPPARKPKGFYWREKQSLTFNFLYYAQQNFSDYPDNGW
jgi:hypothetical protein